MKRTTYQVPELRDENDNIIQEGAFGKNTALANSTNDGWIDYVANDLMYLYNNTMGGTGGEINTETITGKTGTITNLTATTVKADTLTADALNGPLTGNVTGDLTGNVTGDVTGNLTGNVTGTADKATADAAGNNIQTTYAKKADLSSSLSTTSLTVTGATSVPTANAGNSSKAIANTEYVQGELTNYLPLSGGTMTGNTLITMGNGESYVRCWDNGLYLGGTYRENASRLVLFTNLNAGGFQLDAGDGTTFKRMEGRPDGRLTWDGNNILTAANYNSYALPLSGGTLTGAINTANNTWNKLGDDASFGDHNIGGKMCVKSQTSRNTGIAFFNQSDTNVGEVDVNNAFDFNKPVKENGGFLVPIGVVQAFAGTTIPSGWLLCDGSAVSRTTYANLYACIGTTYGAGDGSTTFNLPNLVDKFIEGSATAGTVKSAGLPNITGMAWGISGQEGSKGYNDGSALRWDMDNYGEAESLVPSSGNALRDITFSASWCNSIYGNSTTVQPPALTMRYIIKY